ncbi:hypothetical protein THAOC_09515 [Thalassiosira oceanica]|uniref:Dynein regulatory complex protein 12 n=1 Tax=Thalassiosira oceanica TaxID=159749 RepID=K0SV04_THAOC|nr:hypothetical protein THAOC_09515 [Thalassiosira oceanica]|eukprot:EJK69245.1 hypothetical protein THAOC_09515 [Thalassiosira oceanica]
MPPKKGKGGKKKAGDTEVNGLPMLPEDRVMYLESKEKALENELAQRSESAALALSEYVSTKEILDKTREEAETLRESTHGILQSMTRQYRGMEEDLLQKIVTREKKIQEQRDEIAMLKASFAEHKKQKVWELRQKDDEMASLRKETKELCQHFGGLLKEARTFITETLAER